jgi:peptidoglycan/LPS O-acetylase OafA/YrhL
VPTAQPAGSLRRRTPPALRRSQWNRNVFDGVNSGDRNTGPSPQVWNRRDQSDADYVRSERQVSVNAPARTQTEVDTGPRGVTALRPKHCPELDGLRALAVTLVLAFHCDLSVLPGGYLGVDVFFVLSGYLITGLMLSAGSDFNILAFYARRARRLLPMALLVILTISVTWLLVSSAVTREPLIADARSATLYFANWHFAGQATDYFASANAPSPFLHFWSLSVEEQFYLIWPVLVMLAITVSRGRRRQVGRLLTATASILALGSLITLGITTHAGDSSYSYFGTAGRIYQLLGGALLALRLRDSGSRRSTPGRRDTLIIEVVQIACIVGLVVVASKAIHEGPAVRGLLATGLTVSLLLALFELPDGRGSRILRIPPLVYIGEISYATYLWHWPVILLIRMFVTITPHILFAVAFPISLGLAALSQRLIEQPIRRAPTLSRYPRPVVATGAVACLVVGLILAPALLRSPDRPVVTSISAISANSVAGPPTTSHASSSSSASATPIPSATLVPSAADIAQAGDSSVPRICLQKVVDKAGCLDHRGTAATVLVIGDSHLDAFLPVFDQLAARHNLTLYTWTLFLCPWQRGVVPADTPGQSGDPAGSCHHSQEELYKRVLPQIKPDVTIVITRGYNDPNYPRPLFYWGAPQTTDPSTVLTRSMPGAVSAVLANSKRLVVMEPWPSLPTSQRACLSASRYDEQCIEYATGKLPDEAEIETIAKGNPRVTAEDLDASVCPHLPACDPVVNGHIVRRDQDHLSVPFASTLAPVLDRKLETAGAFHR